MTKTTIQFPFSPTTRLDFFAGLAMQAMIMRGSLTASPHITVADEAYRMAIAMLESKTKEKWEDEMSKVSL